MAKTPPLPCVFPLRSRPRHRPLPCVPTAFVAKTRLVCPTAFAAKTAALCPAVPQVPVPLLLGGAPLHLEYSFMGVTTTMPLDSAGATLQRQMRLPRSASDAEPAAETAAEVEFEPEPEPEPELSVAQVRLKRRCNPV